MQSSSFNNVMTSVCFYKEIIPLLHRVSYFLSNSAKTLTSFYRNFQKWRFAQIILTRRCGTN